MHLQQLLVQFHHMQNEETLSLRERQVVLVGNMLCDDHAICKLEVCADIYQHHIILRGIKVFLYENVVSFCFAFYFVFCSVNYMTT